MTAPKRALRAARDAGRAAPRLVTVTPWGADADRSGGISDELLVQTATGFLLTVLSAEVQLAAVAVALAAGLVYWAATARRAV